MVAVTPLLRQVLIATERGRLTQASTDVLVVGGGPAGLAAAIALRQRGIDCVVAEARGIGIDKACGEGLMPDALLSLHALGVTLTAADGFAFRGIRFENSSRRVEASFPIGKGLGVRRPFLHTRLAERASDVGVKVLWNSRVKLPHAGSRDAKDKIVRVNGEPVRYRWLVGADGHGSMVRRWAGLEDVKQKSLRYGFRRHYQVEPWSEYVEIHWGERAQLYVSPVASDCVCVISMTRDPRRLGDDMLAGFPRLAARLNGTTSLSAPRGAVSATCKLHRVANESVALIGDASGSADSITGAGLAVSFRQAHALADAIAMASLEPYRQTHEEIGKLSHAMGKVMLLMDRWPALGRRGMDAFSASPELFEDLLAVHVGAKSRLRLRCPKDCISVLASLRGLEEASFLSSSMFHPSRLALFHGELLDHNLDVFNLDADLTCKRDKDLLLNLLVVEQAGERVMIVLGTELSMGGELSLADGENKDQDQLKDVRTGKQERERVRIDPGEDTYGYPDGLNKDGKSKRKRRAGEISDLLAKSFNGREPVKVLLVYVMCKRMMCGISMLKK